MTMERAAAFFDLDNTLLCGSSLFHLGWGGFKRGMFSPVEALRFALADFFFRITRTEADAAPATWGNFAASFANGSRAADLVAVGREIMEESVLPALRSGILDMARRHLADGDEVWIVTASPIELAQMLAADLGFTGGLGTEAEVRDGRYTGNLPSGILHGPRKAQAVQDLAKQRGIDLARSSAYSDSINDLPMLLAVGFPQVVTPDRQLARTARQNKWAIHEAGNGLRSMMKRVVPG
jgi:HAD superfamily hydrolase (TIGR01490 family)